MSAKHSDFSVTEALAIDEAAKEVFTRLRGLPSPRRAAVALSVAQAELIYVAGGDDERRVREMLQQANVGALKQWCCMTGKALSQ